MSYFVKKYFQNLAFVLKIVGLKPRLQEMKMRIYDKELNDES
ncbi:hypothetical protein [Campylobacter upsaliensis]|nr:hypothetical protein [Campylobacter upsaliensis]MEB2788950.1 hypothetical protein [Campylobacter upsaliensis]MEB2798019.1 hypothetical protein [Campylobacter upsaliensis]